MTNISLLKELTEFRRMLHANPELSGEERQTAEAVKSFLEKQKPSTIIENVGGHGLLAVFDSGKPGPSVLFRGDMDALPIEEINDFEYKSGKKGVSHKCGHDGHTAMLLGFAHTLSNNPPASGIVILLFQPSEEDGRGAKAVSADPKFRELKPDFVFALHNLPGFPLHEVIVKSGSFTSAVKSIIIYFRGKTAHAGEPENGINPGLPMAEVLSEADKLSNNAPEREDFTLITPVHASFGEIAYGISAGYGELRLTIRTWTEEEMQKLADNLDAILNQVSDKYGIGIDFEWTHEFIANQNEEFAVEVIRQSASELSLSVNERKYPFKWGEDFGLFTQEVKGAMFGIGSGEECPALHNPDYDFPDEILTTGIKMFHQISLHILK